MMYQLISARIYEEHCRFVPNPWDISCPESVAIPLQATAATSSYHSVVWFARVALWTRLLRTLCARMADQQWLCKRLKERPRFWTKPLRWNKGGRQEGVFVLNSVNSFWQIHPQRGCLISDDMVALSRKCDS
jgi:hypothetical protein